MNCEVANNKLVPLSKVVKASIVDSYADIGRTEQTFSHWACRGLKKLTNEILPKVQGKVLLTVNGNTHTATLPLDFQEETFVGYIDERGYKIPFALSTDLYDSKNITTVDCDDSSCAKCGQSTNICNDLVVTEDTELIVINDSTYEKTVIKKLYPNGDYWLETSTPVLDINTDTVGYASEKEFIVNLDLKPCGCLETTEENIAKIQSYCPSVYCSYYAPCGTCTTPKGYYKIFEESGLIQLNASFPYTQIYMEYNGFLNKKNGQYQVPQVAFETLVEWTKWKSIANKSNIAIGERLYQLESYKRERRNMEKVLGKISLYQIIQSIDRVPKFDIDYSEDWYGCFTSVPNTIRTELTTTTTDPNTGECCTTTTVINRTNFTLAVKVDGGAGHPVNGQSTYQNNILKGALDVNYLFLAKQIFTILDGDFSFDAETGTVDISPNQFFTGDTLIINYNKNL